MLEISKVGSSVQVALTVIILSHYFLAPSFFSVL